MFNFIKKAMILNLLAVSLGGVSQAYAAQWDWLVCVKKDGSSRTAVWNHYSQNGGLVLLNTDSKTAHKSIGGYTWLSVSQPPNNPMSYLTDGNQAISLPGAIAEKGCKELIKSCQLLDPAYEYVGTTGRKPIVILRSDSENDLRKKLTICPYFGMPQNSGLMPNSDQ